MPYQQRASRVLSRHIITHKSLQEANRKVARDMAAVGLWSELLTEVEVRLVPVSLQCYGWHDGVICIPMVSGAQIFDLFHGRHTRLTDILRHEWAHAIADVYPDLVESDHFVRCFGGEYEDLRRVHHDPNHHVTRYASVMPCEDFAEVFHFYLRHGGRIPLRLSHKKIIVRKWKFIDRIARRISGGRCRF